MRYSTLMVSKIIKCLECGEEFNRATNESCPKCETPHLSDPESPDPLTQKIRLVVLSTTDQIGERQIIDHLGLVFGAGNAAWTIESTAGRANTALGKAEEQLRRSAAELGANAVIGITFSMDSSSSALNRSQAITLLGTAVKLR